MVKIKNELHLYIYNLLKGFSQWFHTIDENDIYRKKLYIKIDYEFIFITISLGTRVGLNSLNLLKKLICVKEHCIWVEANADCPLIHIELINPF